LTSGLNNKSQPAGWDLLFILELCHLDGNYSAFITFIAKAAT
jgi:hypothetical protein